MEFSWTDPLKVDGQEIATNDYSRIANTYCRVEFDTKVYDISSYARNERNRSSPVNIPLTLSTLFITVGLSVCAAASEPEYRQLFDYPVRDTCICLVDGTYYLTGTTGFPTWWKTNEGIRIWKSPDLKEWTPLGLVWSFEKDATWQKPVKEEHRAIWAPELHYFNNTFWITYCVNWPGGGTGILKSVSGKAEGPYRDICEQGPLTQEIDASLFVDDGGVVYFVFQNGKLARMKDDMSGLAETPRQIRPDKADQVGFEGAFLFKANGCYYLSCADFVGPKDDPQYHCFVAQADRLEGPWSERYLAVPSGGHNMFFQAQDGSWYSTVFGNDSHAPFKERPGIVPIAFDATGKVAPK